jgi:outer membrane lipoprotein SlyB
MIGKWVRLGLLPLVLAAGLAACDSGGVQPGIVNTSAAGAAGPAGSNGTTVMPGGNGRVVSIREVGLKGAGGGGSGQGALMGGMLGAAGGGVLGGITSNSLGGGLVGALLGAVGGAIAGSIIDGQRGSGRGIEVTVQRDDGQQTTVAQRDDGDVQLGDRVQIVQDRQGVAKVVRDTSRAPDAVSN